MGCHTQLGKPVQTHHKQHKINHKCSHSRNDHPGLTAEDYLFKSINLGKLSMQNWQTACRKKITWSNNYIFINSMFTCPLQLSPWVATIISTMICRHQLIWCALTKTQLHWGCHNRIKERLVTCLSSHKLSLMDLKCREKNNSQKTYPILWGWGGWDFYGYMLEQVYFPSCFKPFASSVQPQ